MPALSCITDSSTHISSYHLHLQFPDLFIQTLPPRVLAGLVRGGQRGVPTEGGRIFSHPPEQTFRSLPADFHLQVLQVRDGLADRDFVHLLWFSAQMEEVCLRLLPVKLRGFLRACLALASSDASREKTLCDEQLFPPDRYLLGY